MEVDGCDPLGREPTTGIVSLAQDDFKDVVVDRLDLILTASHLLQEVLNLLGSLGVFRGSEVFTATTATATVALTDVDGLHLIETDFGGQFGEVEFGVFVTAVVLVIDLVIHNESQYVDKSLSVNTSFRLFCVNLFSPVGGITGKVVGSRLETIDFLIEQEGEVGFIDLDLVLELLNVSEVIAIVLRKANILLGETERVLGILDFFQDFHNLAGASNRVLVKRDELTDSVLAECFVVHSICW